jgi:hypothetical protein
MRLLVHKEGTRMALGLSLTTKKPDVRREEVRGAEPSLYEHIMPYYGAGNN